MAVQMRYGDYVKQAFDIVKANLVPSIVLVALPIIPLVGLVMPIFLVNYLAAVKAAKNEGKSMELGDLFNFENAVDKWVGVFLVILINGLASMCVIGGIITGGLFLFVPAILADKPGTPFMSAIKASFYFGKANLVPLILLSIVAGIVYFVGILACGLGVFITMPVAAASIYIAYEDHRSALEAAAAEGGVAL